MRIKLIIILSLIVFSFTNSYAIEFKDISAEELKRMIDKKMTIVIVDTREEYEFKAGRIPASINVPPEKVNFIEKFLPKNKNTLIIFYCKGWT